MRKLFAMVATVAVVLSMFSGIAFAALDPAYRLVLTENATVTCSNTASDIVVVKGMAYHNNVALPSASSGSVSIDIDSDPTSAGVQPTVVSVNADGSFFFPIDRNAAPAVFTAKLSVTGAADVAEAKVTRKANATITTPTFEYKTSPLETLRVTLTDADGKALSNALATGITTVTLTNTTDALTGTVQAFYPSTGALLILVSGWTNAGTYTLNLNGVAHGTVTVTEVGALGISAMPTASIQHNVPTHVVLKLTGTAGDIVAVTVTGPGTLTLLPTDPAGGALAATQNYTIGSNGTKEIAFDATFDAVGAYTFTASKSGFTNAKVVMQVVSPTAGITEYVRTSKLTEITVGSNTISIGPDQEYELVSYSYNTATPPVLVKDTAVTYTVTVDGSAATLTPVGSHWTFPVNADKLGEKTVRIASFVGGVKKLDKEYVVKVTGWDVSYDVSKFIVNQAQNVSFTIKDSNGNAINNALIYVVDAVTVPDWTTFSGLGSAAKTAALLVNPTTTNVSNGTYTKSNLKYSTVGQKNIFVTKGNGTDLMAQFSKGITVTGNSVYTVTSDVQALLSGKQQTVTLTVTGNTDMPQFVEKQVGSTITSLTPSSVSGDTIKVPVHNNDTKDVTLRVYNGAGDKCGEVVLKTVAPKLVFEQETTTVTENIYTGLKFQVVDPRDNSVLTKDVKISAVNAPTLGVYTADKKGVLSTTLNASSSYDVALLVQGLDWDTLNKFEDTATVKFKVTIATGVDVNAEGTLQIVKPSLTSNPEQVVLGQATNLTLTYKDGNGNALANKKVYQGSDNTGIELGTTDSNGQILVANQAATSSLKFAAATDVATKYATLTVAVGVDNKKPVVTADATTDKSTATISISDNVLVTRLMVNGSEISIFPRAEVKHVVNLKVGVNTFTIIAMDNNYNVAEETVTITYTPAANNSTVLQGGAVERKGDYVFVQIRQFEDLGATLTWNAAAKTATFVAGGKTVEVTVGSTTAKVNGEAATMPSAPINVGGRVMVPTRFIAEALGWTVDWAAGDIVTITLP